MSPLSAFLALVILISTVVVYEDIKRRAPSPYAQCAKMPTKAEQRQCERMVDFALSAGW